MFYRWFIQFFIGFQHVSTIRLVVQEFATIQRTPHEIDRQGTIGGAHRANGLCAWGKGEEGVLDLEALKKALNSDAKFAGLSVTVLQFFNGR